VLVVRDDTLPGRDEEAGAAGLDDGQRGVMSQFDNLCRERAQEYFERVIKTEQTRRKGGV
jgi:hypothetical protein